MLKVASATSRAAAPSWPASARGASRPTSPRSATRSRSSRPSSSDRRARRSPASSPTSTARRSPRRASSSRPRREKDVDPAFASAFRLARRRLTAYHRRQLPKGLLLPRRARRRVRREAGPARGRRRLRPGRPRLLPVVAPDGRRPGARRRREEDRRRDAAPRIPGEPRAALGARASSASTRSSSREGRTGSPGSSRWRGCTKVVGPGNRWVAAAKHLVSGLVSIDMPGRAVGGA